MLSLQWQPLFRRILSYFNIKMDFTPTILSWYSLNKRNLPWRNTTDPFKIWLSEVILQQTRVAQGMDYYHAFTKRFRKINELAKAKEDEVLKLWQGLGYYSRARNLHHTAKIIATQYKGRFPDTYEKILQLKGIGPYTAAAIASFAFGECKSVVDGNVSRVLSRYFGVKDAIDSPAGKKIIMQLAEECIDKKRPALFNQSIMEFGALQCVPKNPDCGNCVLKNSCYAFAKKMQHSLPVKAKKTAIKNIYPVYFFIQHNQHFYLRKRTGNDIWKGLYELPNTEVQNIPVKKEIPAIIRKSGFFKENNISFSSFSKTYKHLLSHRNIFAVFVTMHAQKGYKPVKEWVKSPLGKDPVKPVPRLIDIFLTEMKK